MTALLPVTLIGGYLGAGKTTLVNGLLRNAAGRRFAVLVNEFGALPIDADLIVARDDNLISISGGCICCGFGSDLVAALINIRGGNRAIDHLLIETSGVALPGSIVQSIALLPSLAVDGVIVLADAETIEERVGDLYMSDTVRGQLAAADIILLNRIDLVSQERVAATARRLAEIAPGVRVLSVQNAKIPPEIVVGGNLELQHRKGSIEPVWHQSADYDTISLEVDGPRDAEELARALTDPRLGLLRVKGFLLRPDGAFITLQIVGRRSLVDLAPSWIEGPGRLVCIGLATEMDRAAILEVVKASSKDVAVLRYP